MLLPTVVNQTKWWIREVLCTAKSELQRALARAFLNAAYGI